MQQSCDALDTRRGPKQPESLGSARAPQRWSFNQLIIVINFTTRSSEPRLALIVALHCAALLCCARLTVLQHRLLLTPPWRLTKQLLLNHHKFAQSCCVRAGLVSKLRLAGAVASSLFSPLFAAHSVPPRRHKDSSH